MEIKEILSQIRSIVNNALGGGFSFGQPSKLGNLYVIPVARVIYGMGGGGDETTPEKEKPEGEGWVCDECAPKHKCGEDMLLPVVNSPRVGMCGYTGF